MRRDGDVIVVEEPWSCPRCWETGGGATITMLPGEDVEVRPDWPAYCSSCRTNVYDMLAGVDLPRVYEASPCLRCGALVADVAVHGAWHDRQDAG